MDKYYLTKERFEELKRELEELRTKKRMEIAERLKRAKEFGDLSENSEYTEAREEQSWVETRIFELEEMMKKYVLIEKQKGASDVQIGSTVTVKKGDKVSTYMIVGSNEANPREGKISNESPIGRALLKHKVGDTVTVKTPAGETAYQITKIE